MIAGIGVDVVDLNHMKTVYQNNPRIYKKILTPEECTVFESRTDKRKIEYLAGRFAAKEAFSKAMGTGIGKTVTFQNVTVLNAEKGQPIVAESPFAGNVFVSISHSRQLVTAQIVLEKNNDGEEFTLENHHQFI